MIDKDQIEKLTRAAKLKISDKDFNEIKASLKEIVEFIKKLQIIKEKPDKEAEKSDKLNNVLRQDEVDFKNSILTDEFLSSVDKKHNSLVRVSAIIKKDQ